MCVFVSVSCLSFPLVLVARFFPCHGCGSKPPSPRSRPANSSLLSLVSYLSGHQNPSTINTMDWMAKRRRRSLLGQKKQPTNPSAHKTNPSTHQKNQPTNPPRKTTQPSPFSHPTQNAPPPPLPTPNWRWLATSAPPGAGTQPLGHLKRQPQAGFPIPKLYLRFSLKPYQRQGLFFGTIPMKLPNS